MQVIKSTKTNNSIVVKAGRSSKKLKLLGGAIHGIHMDSENSIIETEIGNVVVRNGTLVKFERTHLTPSGWTGKAVDPSDYILFGDDYYSKEEIKEAEPVCYAKLPSFIERNKEDYEIMETENGYFIFTSWGRMNARIGDVWVNLNPNIKLGAYVIQQARFSTWLVVNKFHRIEKLSNFMYQLNDI